MTVYLARTAELVKLSSLDTSVNARIVIRDYTVSFITKLDAVAALPKVSQNEMHRS